MTDVEATNQDGKRTMSLELFGQHLTVVSDNDEQRIRDIVDFVNRRLAEIKDASKRVQIDQIALLAALNIAEELFEERQKNQALRRQVRDRSLKLLNAIDAMSRDIDSARAQPETTT